MRTDKISVCMAAYNGSKYIYDQLVSILDQLITGDELIIVDDSSTDSTVEILNGLKDPRITVIVNESNMGVNKSFEKAISLSNNEFIFMADQDDIWADERVDKMVNILKNSEVNLVSGNSRFIDSNGSEIEYPIIPLMGADSKKLLKNISSIFGGIGAYYGCAMAFKRELISLILPFPTYIESHDLWIAKASILQGRSFNLEDIVLYRRIHNNNASVVSRPMAKKIWSRFIFALSIVDLLYRNFRTKK